MRRMLIFAMVVALMGFGSFLYFRVYTDENIVTSFSYEITVALFGSVITVAITAVLLQAQVVHEVRREKSVGVFQEKLALYKGFVEFLNSIIDDDEIEHHELVQMRAWALKLSLVAGWGIVAEINHFIAQTLEFRRHRYSSLTDEHKERWKAWYAETTGRPPGPEIVNDECPHFTTVGRIVSVLKEDLGEESLSGDIEIGSIWRTIDELLKSKIAKR